MTDLTPYDAEEFRRFRESLTPGDRFIQVLPPGGATVEVEGRLGDDYVAVRRPNGARQAFPIATLLNPRYWKPLPETFEDTEWQDAWERAQQDADKYRAALLIADAALQAIVSPDCMTEHAEGGGWIDTEAPARIAEGALERIRGCVGALSPERPCGKRRISPPGTAKESGPR